MRRSYPSAPSWLIAGLLSVPAVLAQEGVPSRRQADACLVEVLRGSARVLCVTGDEATLTRDDVRSFASASHLEVSAGAEVRLTWPGRASLRVWGPAGMEWNQRVTPARSNALPAIIAADLEWTLFDVARMDLEVRRGDHVLHLPGAWRIDLGTSALHLRPLPSGLIEVRHHAGSPATLHWLGDRAQARPPLALYAGSTLRLGRPMPFRADASPRADAWGEHSWPWRAERDTPTGRTKGLKLEQETGRIAGYPAHDPRQTSPVNTVRGSLCPMEVRIEVVELASSTQRGAAKAVIPRTAPQRERTERETVRPQTSTRPLPLPPPTRDFDPAHWRGLARSDLATPGNVATQKRDDVEVRVLSIDRIKVLVDALAEEGAWCFGPDEDWRLEPGAVVVFNADGSLKLGFGRYAKWAKVPARPTPAELR